MQAQLFSRIELKSLDESTGEFEGYASTYGNVDLGNDIVAKGAFDETLASGQLPALCWQHELKEVIGEWLSMKSDAIGLLVKGRIWIGKGIQRAEQAWAMLKSNGPKGLSIGFIVRAARKAANGVRTITKAILKEVSVVTYPMNEKAQILSVKSEDLEAMCEGKAHAQVDPMVEKWTAEDCAGASGKALVAAKKCESKRALDSSLKADDLTDAALLGTGTRADHAEAASAHGKAASAHSVPAGSPEAMRHHQDAQRAHLALAASASAKKSDDHGLELKEALARNLHATNAALVEHAVRRTVQLLNPRQ